jgi:hypothetical protein
VRHGADYLVSQKFTQLIAEYIGDEVSRSIQNYVRHYMFIALTSITTVFDEAFSTFQSTGAGRCRKQNSLVLNYSEYFILIHLVAQDET